MKYILNIGLNNTNYSKVVEQINNARGHYFKDYHIKQVVSSYNNEIEPTAVLTFDTETHYTSILNLVRGWCKVLNQVCIAINISNTSPTLQLTKYATNLRILEKITLPSSTASTIKRR